MYLKQVQERKKRTKQKQHSQILGKHEGGNKNKEKRTLSLKLKAMPQHI